MNAYQAVSGDRALSRPFLASPRAVALLFTALAIAVLAAGLSGLSLWSAGPLAHHMGIHILLMNAVAPLIAVAAAAERRRPAGWLGSGRALASTSVVQIALLWAAHVPAIVEATMASSMLGAILSAALASSAFLFWTSVLAQRGGKSWQALVALLFTGKIFCLLAALLVFAPRLLYPGVAAGDGSAAAGALADQQTAGLVMIAICPLTYVAAAIAITARWLGEIGSKDRAPSPLPRCH